MSKRPNILVLITDQQCVEALSCAGNPWLHTPAMDRLAARGTRFARAYCSQPLCTPSRASAFTGCWPHQVDAQTNMGKLFWYHDIPRERLLGHPFAQAGYRCVYAGKDMAPADGSRDFELLCGWGDDQTADHLVDFLGADHRQPFLAVGAFLNPHAICEYADGRGLPEPFPHEEPPLADLPPLPTNFAPPTDEPSIIRSHQRAGDRTYHGQHYGDEDWRRYRWAYHRMVEDVDACIGRVLDALEAAGLQDDTLIYFTSDHGDGCGAHRWNQKQVLYEESIHIPMILAGPGVAAGRIDAEHLISWGLDMFPTLTDAAGLPTPDWCTGRSLLALTGDRQPGDWREHLVVETTLKAEHGGPWQRNRGRCVLTADGWKYTCWSWGRPRESLVDLNADPGEMVNLAVCRPYHGRRDDFRALLAEHCRATDDDFRVAGYDAPLAADRCR